MYYAIELPFRVPFSVETDLQETEQILKLEYGKFVRTCSVPYPHILRIEKEHNLYLIHCKDRIRRVEDAAAGIHSAVYETVGFQDSVLPFHGAALSYNGKAHLFLAPTTGGKTTLAAYLTYRGFGYLSDDCILLDRKNDQVHPSPTPIHLREGGYQVLSELGALTASCTVMGAGDSRRYVFTPQNISVQPLPIGGIYWLKRTEDRNECLPCGTAEKVKGLLSSLLVYRPVDAAMIQCCMAAAKQGGYMLLYKDMEYVYELVSARSTAQ